jgi:hypothetical protein
MLGQQLSSGAQLDTDTDTDGCGGAVVTAMAGAVPQAVSGALDRNSNALHGCGGGASLQFMRGSASEDAGALGELDGLATGPPPSPGGDTAVGGSSATVPLGIALQSATDSDSSGCDYGDCNADGSAMDRVLVLEASQEMLLPALQSLASKDALMAELNLTLRFRRAKEQPVVKTV